MIRSKLQQTGASSLLRIHGSSVAADLPLSIGAISQRALVRKLGGVKIPTTTTCSSSTRRRFLSSSSKGSKQKGKKPKLSSSGSKGVEAVWCKSATPSAPGTKSLEMGRYGLKRLDYTAMEPPVWTTPPHPPTKTTAERLVFPLSIAVVAGIALWVYMNPEEDDMSEYWKRVESGQILLYDDDDDDDDDDDEDDDES